MTVGQKTGDLVQKKVHKKVHQVCSTRSPSTAGFEYKKNEWRRIPGEWWNIHNYPYRDVRTFSGLSQGWVRKLSVVSPMYNLTLDSSIQSFSLPGHGKWSEGASVFISLVMTSPKKCPGRIPGNVLVFCNISTYIFSLRFPSRPFYETVFNDFNFFFQ